MSRPKTPQPSRTQETGPDRAETVRLEALYGLDGPEGRVARGAAFEATPERAAVLTSGPAPLARPA